MCVIVNVFVSDEAIYLIAFLNQNTSKRYGFTYGYL